MKPALLAVGLTDHEGGTWLLGIAMIEVAGQRSGSSTAGVRLSVRLRVCRVACRRRVRGLVPQHAMTVDLPAPPSTNALYVMRDGLRRKTSVYQRWRRDARLLLSGMRRLPPKTPLGVTIEVAVNRTRDVDNLIKPIQDALQAAGVIHDDRWVDDCGGLTLWSAPSRRVHACWRAARRNRIRGSRVTVPGPGPT